MHHFFIDENEIEGDVASLYGEDVNHIVNVLRMKIGEEILLSDSKGNDYNCEITSISKEKVCAKVRFKYENGHELKQEITLFQGLPKSDKMELIIQKCVELGAFDIVPVEMKHCVVKLDEKGKDSKQKRWQAISLSAAKQSKRSIVPNVSRPISFKAALELACNYDLIIVPYESAKGMDYTKEVFESAKNYKKIGVFIGPEGGFDSTEIEDLSQTGGKIVTLGKRILRTETAGMMVIGILSYLLEE